MPKLVEFQTMVILDPYDAVGVFGLDFYLNLAHHTVTLASHFDEIGLSS